VCAITVLDKIMVNQKCCYSLHKLHVDRPVLAVGNAGKTISFGVEQQSLTDTTLCNLQ